VNEESHALVALGLLPSFTTSMKELAECFGLTLARLVADEIEPQEKPVQS
jgi:hypothetical protein